ncbi:Emopamil-binding protein [Penicillium odoratum]|uniref:Emopamil-binding protein n=1 Tax=Penicillium odoratum TaxID=1167516 RepID=UPI002549627B|nr:Emopamil-binding protein [Penicillium odoratum]KAJ5752690.1 Emopamil-binding protein [Penicillium odoratum]
MAHPYYPVRQDIGGYIANASSTLNLLSIFVAGLAMSAFILTIRLYPRTSFGDLWTIVWFALCEKYHFIPGGCVHLFFEGYFAYNFRRMPAMTDVFGQLWKEYSLSDSRYQTQSAFVLCMESVTAFIWGPLSFAMVFRIIRDHPLRHAVQLIFSLGQLYGVILYYATSLFDHYVLDIANSRPESQRFWGYFILCNGFWVIVPSSKL